MKDERTLEKELLKIGLFSKKTDALEGVKLDAGSLTKFVNKNFRPWPERLADADAYAEALDAALVSRDAKFYTMLEADNRKTALRHLVVWEVWENKYRLQSFENEGAGTAVTGVKNSKAIVEVMSRTFGALVNGRTNGKPVTNPQDRDTWWRLYAGFMKEHGNAYLLEPLRRMGLLDKDDETPRRPDEGKEARP